MSASTARIECHSDFLQLVRADRDRDLFAWIQIQQRTADQTDYVQSRLRLGRPGAVRTYLHYSAYCVHLIHLAY